MAKVTARCEFMENAFPAGPLALKGTFSVVEDSRGEHMIFSVDKRDNLCLILKGAFGQNELINLSSKFGLSESQKVSAFAVSQNKDGKIHLVFAALQSSGFDDLYVVRPMGPDRDEWMAPFSSSDLFTGAQKEINIRQIVLGTSNDSGHDNTQYPQPHLVFRHKHKTTDDFWALTVNAQAKTWVNPNILQMPCNPDQIIDKCPGNLPLYRGMFVLYKEVGTGVTGLCFVGYDPRRKNPTLASIVQQVPEGVCAISPLENDLGYTDIMMAGKHLTWRSSQDCFKGSKSAAAVLSEDPDLSEPVQFHIAQSNDAVSVWSLSKDSLLAYQEFDLNETGPPTSRTPLIPLLDGESRSDRFAALQHPIHGQKLFVVDKNNNVKMLEQSNDSGLWQAPIDVMIPNSDEMITFKSHTIRMQVTDQSNGALANQSFKLCSSTSAELLVNGVSMRGNPTGVDVATDDGGILTVIIKSDGMSGPLVTLQDPDAHTKVLPSPVTVDPMRKLWSTVDHMSSAEGLKSATLTDGTPFLKQGTSSTDIEAAASALKNLRTAKEDIKNPASVKVPEQPPPPPRRRSGGTWGVFYWLKDRISTVTDWVFQKIGQAWKFVVTIAGKVWNFVCETFPQIAEAVQTVLSTIGKGLEWIRDKLFAALGWDDILDTKNILVNVTTQGLLWGADAIAVLETKVDEAFTEMRNSVRTLKGKQLPPQLAAVKPGRSNEKLGATEEETLSSPRAQYGNYHLKHSGSSLDARKERDTAVDRLIERLGNVWSQIEHLVSRLGDNISKVFKNSDFDVQTVLTELGVDLLDDMLAVVQSVVVGILGAVSDLIVDLADGLNKPISIPILSPLYRGLTKNELTILDLVCLCIAIPSTILFKAISGKKPREMEGMGPLTEHNAMIPELAHRIGRAQRESEMPPAAMMVSSSMQTFDTPKISPQPFGPSLESNSVSSFSSKMVSKPREIRMAPNKQERAKINQKRFSKSAYQASSLYKAGVPLGQLIWYQFYTWPRLSMPESAYNPKTALLSAGAKLVLWLGSFVSVASYSKDDIVNGNFDISEKWKDPWFAHRFQIWLVGGLPIIGAMGGKYVGYVFGMTSSIVQTLMLAVLHIKSWTLDAGYSTYLCIEEWSKMVAKLATNFSGLTQGGYGYGAAVALGFTYVGCGMHMTRCGLEYNGNREIMTTGLDMD